VDFEIEEGPCAGVVMADPSQLQQVLQNLVINAREAAGSGEGRGGDGRSEERAGRVAVSVREATVGRDDMLPVSPGAYVRIDVTDDGPGIPAEIAQRIFDPYFTTKSRGSGLGLTVSFSIVTRHGGCISLRARLGEGATFSVYLPSPKR